MDNRKQNHIMGDDPNPSLLRHKNRRVTYWVVETRYRQKSSVSHATNMNWGRHASVEIVHALLSATHEYDSLNLCLI
jgi:hypothetical protein